MGTFTDYVAYLGELENNTNNLLILSQKIKTDEKIKDAELLTEAADYFDIADNFITIIEQKRRDALDLQISFEFTGKDGSFRKFIESKAQAMQKEIEDGDFGGLNKAKVDEIVQSLNARYAKAKTGVDHYMGIYEEYLLLALDKISDLRETQDGLLREADNLLEVKNGQGFRIMPQDMDRAEGLYKQFQTCIKTINKTVDDINTKRHGIKVYWEAYVAAADKISLLQSLQSECKNEIQRLEQNLVDKENIESMLSQARLLTDEEIRKENFFEDNEEK